MTIAVTSLCLLLGACLSFGFSALFKARDQTSDPESPPNSDFYPAVRGQLLNKTYVVRAKLGAGVYSSTWLVSDKDGAKGRPSKFFAAKILSGEATQQHVTGQMLERDALVRVQRCDDINNLPVLRDEFVLRTRGPHGRAHRCFVMDLLGPNLASIRMRGTTKALPYYIVRNIIAQVVEAVVQLHDLNIVHTDIKPDNILLTTQMSDDEIELWLEKLASIVDHERATNTEKSHPLPDKFSADCTPHEAELVSVVLADLGQSQRAGQQPTVDQFSAFSLRAPEAILHSDFGPKVDIWAIGCIVFELLTGRWLFHPEDGGEDWTIEEDHLAKMLELTGETFSDAVRQRSHRWGEYFDEAGDLKRIPDLYHTTIEEALANYNTLPSEEIGPAAEFIRFCLRLDSTDRPTARDVELHPWLLRAFEC